MPESIISYLSSTLATSELIAPKLLQTPGDFPSTATSASTETIFNSADYEDLDWSRLLDYKEPTSVSIRSFTPWIYGWGWRVVGKTNNEAYWLCRLCHNASRARRPSGHIYKAAATNGAMNHLRTVHQLTEDSHLPIERPNQSTLDAYGNTAAITHGQFDVTHFKALILRLFTTTQIPIALIEDGAFRELLIYSEPRLQRTILSRRSLSRYIENAYADAYAKIVGDLQGAITRVNLSFDLWTSLGRLYHS